MYGYIDNTNNCKETSKIYKNINAKTPLNSKLLPYDLFDLNNRLSANKDVEKVFNGFLNINIVHIVAENFLEAYDTIGKFAFSGFDNLESVVLPNSVKKIEFGAFAHLKKLKKVIIPDSVEKIEAYAFFDCPELAEVKLSENLTTIESGTFAFCKSLKEIMIPDSVRKIESFAFNNCDSYFIATNVLPRKQIDSTAFEKVNNSNILKKDRHERSYFKIKNGLKNSIYKKRKYDECIDIGDTFDKNGDKIQKTLCEQEDDSQSYTAGNGRDASFIFCSSEEDEEVSDNTELKLFESIVTKSEASKNVTSTSKESNSDTNAKNNITDTPNNTIKPNIMIVKYDDAKNKLSSENEKVCTIELPDNITKIERKLFERYPNIKEIDLSDAKLVITIGSGAFLKCKQLENVKLPPNLKEIGSLAFYGCLQLSEIKFSSSLRQIEKSAFALCDGLCKIDFSDTHSLETIGECAFVGCRHLTEVKLPKSLNCICKESFYSCDKLEKVDLSELLSLEKIDEMAFGGCSNLREIILPPNLKVIKERVFENCSCLSSIKLPESIEIIKGGAFIGCKSLKRINLPKVLRGISTTAFYNCNNIKFDVSFCQENIKFFSDNEFADADKFNISTLPLYINGGPSYSDVKQGHVCDCSLMSFLSCLAKYQPQKIKDILCENIEENTVAVTLYPFGVKMKYLVTKALPKYLLDNTKCIWFRMIEKAVAFLMKDLGYIKNDNNKIEMKQYLSNSVVGGILNDVPMLLFGRPSEYYKYSKGKEQSNRVFKREYNKKQLDMFSLISSNLKNNNIITLSIFKNNKGLYSNHAYSVLDTRIDEAGRLLIKIRNPHNRSSDKRYYTKQPSGEYTLIQEPYLYDDDEKGPTSTTQAETELDLNMLYEMQVDYKICALNNNKENRLSFEKERYNTINSLKDKRGLNFFNKKKVDDSFNPKNVVRIEDTAEANFDNSNFVRESHLKETNVIVPQGVTVITCGAFTRIESKDDKPIFNYNNNIKSIVLSSSVRYIDESAFYQCNYLKTVDFSKAFSLKTIGRNAFKSCVNLDNVKLPDNLQEIEDEAFFKCLSLQNISFPEKIKIIGNRAFLECSYLEKIDLSELRYLKTIGIKTFEYCISLREVTLPDTMKK